jgi:hypothetical protein
MILAVPSIPPSIALACLKSVPIDVPRAKNQTKYLARYMIGQSTLGYLKSPPEGYLIPGVDIAGGIEQILDKLASGAYKTQWEWSWDIENIFIQASDGHFTYTPALLQIFAFEAGFSVMSVSDDGISLPKIYHIDDLDKSRTMGYKASPITYIDKVPVLKYLEKVSSTTQQQDPDAMFNVLFTTYPSAWTGLNNWFRRGAYSSLPDKSVVTFLNGTKTTFTNHAIVRQDLTGIKTGQDLHIAYEVPSPSNSTRPAGTKSIAKPSSKPTIAPPATSTAATITAVPTLPVRLEGYPEPVVMHAGRYMSGYFLDRAHNDTAVLAILAFEDTNNGTDSVSNDIKEVRRVIREFLAKCRAAGKTKLVIDVSGNGGGLIVEAWELYKNLFPAADPWSAHRIRASEGMNFTGFWLSSPAAANRTDNDTGIDALIDNVVDGSGKPFSSWSALYGPEHLTQDDETHMMYFDWTKPDTEAPDFMLTGYDPSDHTAPTEVAFKPQDIVVLTDGICASTCAIFTGLLTREQGVRTIALGGRPLQAPMQAVGGVKGSLVQEWSIIGLLANVSMQLAEDAGEIRIPDGVPNLVGSTLNPDAMSGSLNLFNAYTRNNSDMPVQFLYEAANCRRFYTLDTMRNMSHMWESIADVAWHGAKCAPGSSTNTDGTIGDTTLPYTPAVRSTVPPLKGPGSLSYKPRVHARAIDLTTLEATDLSIPADKMDLLYRKPKLPLRLEWWYRD